jgi:hypothetical protein
MQMLEGDEFGSIADLYPDLSRAEQDEAETNLAAYIEVICQIVERTIIDRNGPSAKI